MGRRPVTPQNAAGVMMDPDVSDPMAYGTSPAATAAPDPLEEPPAQCPRLQGVFPGPWREAEG